MSVSRKTRGIPNEATRPMRVLIADDNVALADSIAAVLRARGAQTAVASDGRSALDLVRRGAFDAALVDLKLPGISGVEVLEHLRTQPAPSRLMAMTGYDSPERIAQVQALGVERVFRKPFDLGDLIGSLGLDPAPDHGAPGLSRSRIAVSAPPGRALRIDGSGCTIHHYDNADRLREAVADHPYDAVIVLVPGEEGADLMEDVKLLDPDVAVLAEDRPAAVVAGVERTRERRRAARRLQTLERLFDALPAGVLVLDGIPPDVRFWNPAFERLLGWRPGEPGELTVDELEPAEAEGALARAVAQVRRSRVPAPVDLVLRLRGGALRAFHATASPAGPYDSAVCVVLAPETPSTSHAEALQGLGSTAAGVAHEMRNALAGIGNSLTVMRGRLAGATAAAELLDRVLERVARAREVMEDLLAYARPLTLRLKAVPARLVLDAVADQVREAAFGKVRVEVDVPDPSLRILVDPDRLHQALLNLGMNAVQAMSGLEGAVRLRCVRESDHIALRVDDDGPGIPSEHRGRLFQPFFTTRPQGSGLGLANVRKVIEAHGGTISLVPESPGAHFQIRIPPRPQVREEP